MGKDGCSGCLTEILIYIGFGLFGYVLGYHDAGGKIRATITKQPAAHSRPSEKQSRPSISSSESRPRDTVPRWEADPSRVKELSDLFDDDYKPLFMSKESVRSDKLNNTDAMELADGLDPFGFSTNRMYDDKRVERSFHMKRADNELGSSVMRYVTAMETFLGEQGFIESDTIGAYRTGAQMVTSGTPYDLFICEGFLDLIIPYTIRGGEKTALKGSSFTTGHSTARLEYTNDLRASRKAMGIVGANKTALYGVIQTMLSLDLHEKFLSFGGGSLDSQNKFLDEVGGSIINPVATLLAFDSLKSLPNVSPEDREDAVAYLNEQLIQNRHGISQISASGGVKGALDSFRENPPAYLQAVKERGGRR